MPDKQALGARADLFADHNSKQAHDVVAASAGPSLEEEKGHHGGGSLPRSRQWATWRTTGRRLEGQEEAGTRWRRRQWTGGVPHADPRRSSQGREWAVLPPCLLLS
jgi:hypothetical protein